MSDTTNETTNNNKPELKVCVKVPVGVESRIGAQIGVGFKHKKGEGYNIILDAQPIAFNGRLELVIFPND